MLYYELGEKIECQQSDIIAKKIIPSVPQNHPKIGLSIKYKCKRDGSAEIMKELEPKIPIVDEKSNLNINDKLQANELFFIVKNIKKLNPAKVGGHTGRHSSQVVKTKHYTYAEISKPFLHIQNAIDRKLSLE